MIPVISLSNYEHSYKRNKRKASYKRKENTEQLHWDPFSKTLRDLLFIIRRLPVRQKSLSCCKNTVLVSNLSYVSFEQSGNARLKYTHIYTDKVCDNEAIQSLASDKPRQPLKQVESLLNQSLTLSFSLLHWTRLFRKANGNIFSNHFDQMPRGCVTPSLVKFTIQYIQQLATTK